VTAIDDVSLDVDPGDCVGVVGESGSGKSVTALSILRLHQRATTWMPSGTILYQGQDLLRARASAMRRIRGSEIAMIFQDPMSSLNPVLTIADQISETLRQHRGLTGAAAREARGRTTRPGADSRCRTPRRRLSASPVRRHAAAGDDRHGDRLQATAADCRRADHRARRHHPAQILELLRDLRRS
jgi:ABC-type microcin C transport system duplicated ATPase subunit YejF